MIGLDRPIKPKWIYRLLTILKIGDNPSNYNQPFEEIAEELIGKEGKRKVRTIIFRSFVYSMQKKKTTIENNKFIEWSKTLSLEEIAPLLLLKILIDYDVARFTTNKMSLIADSSNIINTDILTQKIVQEYGDRDLTKRSLRSFLKTLEHFGIIEEKDLKTFRIIKKFNLTDEQKKLFLLTYAAEYLKSEIVDLNKIESTFIYFIENPDFKQTAREYNNQAWEYVRETGREMVIVRRWFYVCGI